MRYFLALFLVFIAPAVAANMTCAVSKQIHRALSQEYREAVTLRMLTHAGNLIEVWRDADRNAWSLTSTTPKGMTCVVQAGTEIETVIWHLEKLSNDL
mgnify:CR=1 FL=1|tara:strand:- start:11 stop:304 length:294 start_codon:yes stop_codon:yes gene_type:complete